MKVQESLRDIYLFTDGFFLWSCIGEASPEWYSAKRYYIDTFSDTLGLVHKSRSGTIFGLNKIFAIKQGLPVGLASDVTLTKKRNILTGMIGASFIKEHGCPTQGTLKANDVAIYPSIGSVAVDTFDENAERLNVDIVLTVPSRAVTLSNSGIVCIVPKKLSKNRTIKIMTEYFGDISLLTQSIERDSTSNGLPTQSLKENTDKETITSADPTKTTFVPDGYYLEQEMDKLAGQKLHLSKLKYPTIETPLSGKEKLRYDENFLNQFGKDNIPKGYFLGVYVPKENE
ncbi:hypothetical protein [Halobacteriovorax sp. ZH2_bin.1]|uniref:hypothetical protein n=1 Tax=unclassified Halobacteriovorax TaxID=2639665 RepID=UPI00371ABC40